jgi:hypothetical protein
MSQVISSLLSNTLQTKWCTIIRQGSVKDLAGFVIVEAQYACQSGNMVTDRLGHVQLPKSSWAEQARYWRESTFTISRQKALPLTRNASDLRSLWNANTVSIAGVLHKLKDERLMWSWLSVCLWPSVKAYTARKIFWTGCGRLTKTIGQSQFWLERDENNTLDEVSARTSGVIGA